jgi:cell surface protein SprA
MNTNNAYYEYSIDVPNMVGQNYITDIRNTQVTLAMEVTDARWIQFKIPVSQITPLVIYLINSIYENVHDRF